MDNIATRQPVPRAGVDQPQNSAAMLRRQMSDSRRNDAAGGSDSGFLSMRRFAQMSFDEARSSLHNSSQVPINISDRVIDRDRYDILQYPEKGMHHRNSDRKF